MNSRRQNGFTLIELMIAMLLGLVVMSGVISVFAQSQRSFKTDKNTADMQAEARDAIEKGVQARNRWVYLHHLRTLRKKVDEMRAIVPGAEAAAAGLDALLAERPGDDGFDAFVFQKTDFFRKIGQVRQLSSG